MPEEKEEFFLKKMLEEILQRFIPKTIIFTYILTSQVPVKYIPDKISNFFLSFCSDSKIVPYIAAFIFCIIILCIKILLFGDRFSRIFFFLTLYNFSAWAYVCKISEIAETLNPVLNFILLLVSVILSAIFYFRLKVPARSLEYYPEGWVEKNIYNTDPDIAKKYILENLKLRRIWITDDGLPFSLEDTTLTKSKDKDYPELWTWILDSDRWEYSFQIKAYKSDDGNETYWRLSQIRKMNFHIVRIYKEILKKIQTIFV